MISHLATGQAELLSSVEKKLVSVFDVSNELNYLGALSFQAHLAALYHLSSGGRRIRANLAISSGIELNLCFEDIVAVATSVELLHNASLVHDDLQDRDTVRRGKPTVWVKYGEEVAVCTGDLMLSAAYASLANIANVVWLPLLLKLMHSRVTEVICGQCIDFVTPSIGRDKVVFNIDDYQNIAIAKSGALLSLPIELCLTLANKQADSVLAREAAQSFAIAYQIQDDLLDVQIDAFRDAKTPGINIIALLTALCEQENLLNKKIGSEPRGNCQEVATRQAQQLALRHIKLATRLVSDLPKNCGVLLQKLADDLAVQLIDGV